jgi:serine/threonine protein phosphatase PrpC
MERLIRGDGLSDKKQEDGFSSKTDLSEFSLSVRKGHEECGDSAFVFEADGRLIAGVFDGVSGEAGAAEASSVAAESVLAFFKRDISKGKNPKGKKRIDEEEMKKALLSANEKIKHGMTTAALVCIEKNGAFIAACVGDSLVYSIDSKARVSAEIQQGRPVGDDHSILKYLYYRNFVMSVLGPSGKDIDMHVRKGKLKEGEVLLLATDGLTDNLYFKVKEGYVSDTAGTEDLRSIINDIREPEALVRLLIEEAVKRMAGEKIELPDRMLVPKKDDIALIAVRWL